MQDKWANCIESVAVFFWGPPTTRKPEELRWGTHGSKVVNLQDGTWYNFEEEIGGGCTKLIETYAPKGTKIEDFLYDVVGLEKSEKRQDIDDIITSTKKETIYDYQDESGKTIYQVVRYEPKTFRQRQLLNGKTVWNLQGVSLLPFRLPNIKANPNKEVIIVEGEKDVLRLEELGLLATCNSGGSGKWTKDHSQYLKDRDVVVIPDNDEPGEKHARTVISTLQGLAKSIKLIELPNLAPKGDIFDWLQDNTADKLLKLVKQTKPLSNKPITPIKVMTINEVMSMEPVPWLVDKMIPTHSMAMVYGSPGSGKTFLALDMALHIANGVSWHGLDVEKGQVFYIAGEGVGGLRKRLKAWHLHHKREASDQCLIIPQSVGLLEDQAIDDLITTIHQLKTDKIQLVIFDTVARCMAGDENSAQDMGQAIKSMDRIRDVFKCTVMPVHHSGKDRDRGARGSTAMIGAVDVSLRVDRQESIVAVLTEKQKDAEAYKPMRFKSVVVDLDTELDLGEETSIVLQYTDEVQQQTEKRLSPAQQLCLEALKEAIDAKGQYMDGKGKCVTEAVWREYAYARALAETPEAKRKAFYRSAKSLQIAGHLQKWEDYVWIGDGTYGTSERDTNVPSETPRKQGFTYAWDN